MSIKRIFHSIIGFLFFIFTISMAVLAVLILIYGNDLPDYKKLASYAPPIATRLYASDGSLLIEYAQERRVFIDFVDIPKQLVNAFVATEDQNFWSHPGIDIQGIIRASANNFMRVLGFDKKFTGASTITQQVAKNFFLSSDRTISRKIKEAILALKLERSFSKEHIMTLYLNQIFLGARAFGVGSASLMYFNKPVSELTLSECAFLAALPKAPNAKTKATSRRDYVLQRMVEERYISQAEADEAKKEPLVITDGFSSQMEETFQYFAEDVRRQLLNTVGRDTLYNDGLYIKTTINPFYQRVASDVLNAALDKYNKARGEELQGAIIVMNPHTGRILAMRGGRNFSESSFNRATQAYRQIGSTIKPFIYLAALEKGFSPVSILSDSPVVSLKEDDTLWKPENYDKKFFGDVTLRFSLETSRNIPTVKLVQQIGINNAIEVAKRFGVYPDNLKNINLSLALGSGETTLEKLVLGYSAFVNGGHLIKPKLVDYIEDRYGNLINKKHISQNIQWNEDLSPNEKQIDDNPLSDKQSLYQLISMLQGVVEMGSGRQAMVKGYDIAGKTGTTNDIKDLWFVGFSKNLIVGVYLGFDTPRTLGNGTGSYMAAQIFSDFMKRTIVQESNQPFSVPDGLTFIRVNRKNGVIASDDPDGAIINEVFKEGQTPNKKKSNSNESENPTIGNIF